mgnify:CR=1 FL=1
MKKSSTRKQNIVAQEKLKTYSFADVFGEDLKSGTFRNVYIGELVRLRLARQIREMRTAQKLTQKEVAQKADMPQSVVARIESGRHSASLDTLERIGHVFSKKVQFV